MYVTASHIIAKYSGQHYTSFVKERIFEPLNMTSSTYFLSEAEEHGVVTQLWAEGRRIPMPINDDDISLHAGPGGILSNAIDLVRFPQFLCLRQFLLCRRRNGGDCNSTKAWIPSQIELSYPDGYLKK